MGLIDSVYAVKIIDAWPLARTFSSLGHLVSSFFPKFILLAGIILFFLVILAGFNMISSAGSGDAHAQEKWKNILTYGVIGFIIIFASFWVLQIINFITRGAFKNILQ